MTKSITILTFLTCLTLDKLIFEISTQAVDAKLTKSDLLNKILVPGPLCAMPLFLLDDLLIT